MKIKDLETTNSLEGIKVKTPKGVVGYWKSQWGYVDGKAGVWLSDGKSSQIYPQFMDELIDALEWEITEEEVNCDKLIGFEFIDNCNEP
jgi:basic membrane lipoprotein Med (substrate-binding protein (PBP1-ABC) superfamily)